MVQGIQLNKDLGFLRIGAAVPLLRVADVDYNVQQIVETVRRAKTLGVQVLHHAPRRQFVIFGVFQAPRDGLEALNELREVGETVEGLGFSEVQVRRVVART